MKVNTIRNVSFQRAFTTSEKQDCMRICDEVKKELGINKGKTIATIFDVQVPKENYDMGMGTMFGKDAQKMAEYLKGMFGITGIQLAPQGQISNYIRSPYSATSFSLGSHLIDPEKLIGYGLLNEQDVKSQIKKGGRVLNSEVVQYARIFDEKTGYEPLLKEAFRNFEQLDNKNPLKKEFGEFRKNNEYWLHKDALFEACAIVNGSRDIRDWSKRDQNIFKTKEGDRARIKLLEQIVDEENDNVVNYQEFVQFIADKQLKEAKAAFNKKGIDIYTDCPVAFSQKDYWAHKSAFHPTQEFGCDGMGNGKYNCWGSAPDFSKLDGEAGELLKQKFDMAFSRYNGVRVDAAWQYIHPMIVEPYKGEDGRGVFEDGNKMGKKVEVRLPHESSIIEDIIMKSADRHGIKRDKVFLEMLGGNSYDGLYAAKKSGGSLIHISRYGDNTWGNPKYYESAGESYYQNMKPGSYIFGIGAHDDPSAIYQARHPEKSEQYEQLATDLHINEHTLKKSDKNMLSALFAQLYTTSDRFVTLPDILGQNKRINTPNTQAGNWEYRAPKNIEKAYYQNAANGHGLNLPEALSMALIAKNNPHLYGNHIKKLREYSEILKDDWEGAPMTTKEADDYFGN